MPENAHDQFPNLRLLEIFPLSARATSWRARTSLDNFFSKEELFKLMAVFLCSKVLIITTITSSLNSINLHRITNDSNLT